MKHGHSGALTRTRTEPAKQKGSHRRASRELVSPGHRATIARKSNRAEQRVLCAATTYRKITRGEHDQAAQSVVQQEIHRRLGRSSAVSANSAIRKYTGSAWASRTRSTAAVQRDERHQHHALDRRVNATVVVCTDRRPSRFGSLASFPAAMISSGTRHAVRKPPGRVRCRRHRGCRRGRTTGSTFGIRRMVLVASRFESDIEHQCHPEDGDRDQ